ncbi:MAG: hypothetical protein WB774_03980 [Xanthobacteraceae bacterium]
MLNNRGTTLNCLALHRGADQLERFGQAPALIFDEAEHVQSVELVRPLAQHRRVELDCLFDLSGALRGEGFVNLALDLARQIRLRGR